MQFQSSGHKSSPVKSDDNYSQRNSSPFIDTGEKYVELLTYDRVEVNQNQSDDEDADGEEQYDLDYQYLKKEKARCVIELKTFIFVIEQTLVEVYRL